MPEPVSAGAGVLAGGALSAAAGGILAPTSPLVILLPLIVAFVGGSFALGAALVSRSAKRADKETPAELRRQRDRVAKKNARLLRRLEDEEDDNERLRAMLRRRRIDPGPRPSRAYRDGELPDDEQLADEPDDQADQ